MISKSKLIYRKLSKFAKMISVDEMKKNAAYHVVNTHVKDGQKIGIGSGSTVVYAIERLATIVEENKWNVICVPTSFQSKQLLIKHKLPVSDLEITPELDIVIDGADEIDPNLTLIKGGGGCLVQEKLVASVANIFIVIADERKFSKCLGTNWKNGVPVEVLPMGYLTVKNKIEKIFQGNATLRPAKSKAGPVVTDNGNFILDWHRDGFLDYESFDQVMNMTPGVVDTGIFSNMAKYGYIGLSDGSIRTINKD